MTLSAQRGHREHIEVLHNRKIRLLRYFVERKLSKRKGNQFFVSVKVTSGKERSETVIIYVHIQNIECLSLLSSLF